VSDKPETDETIKRDNAVDSLLEQFLMEAERKMPLEQSDDLDSEDDLYYSVDMFTPAENLRGGFSRRPFDSPEIVLPRRYHIWPVFITAIAIFILLTGGLTFFNRTVLASQAEEQAMIKKQGDALLDEAIAFIQEADTVVVALDKASESRLDAGDIPKLEALLDQLESTWESLDNAIAKAQQAQRTYSTKADKALAQHAIDAAEYRKKMLGQSALIAEYDIKTIKSASLVEQAWSLIFEADSDMRAAALMVITHGANGIRSSRDYNEQALAKLRRAQEILATIPHIFPEVDLSCITNYLEAKIESAQLALDSDNLYLSGYYTRSHEKTEEFKIKDLEVVELILKIPRIPVTLVFDAYDEATREIREIYKNNRSEAADADAYLRAYLGIVGN